MTADDLRIQAVQLETLDLATAAAFMWVSVSTLRKRAARGKIKGACKNGRSWVFIKADLLDGMREQKEQGCQSSSEMGCGISTSKLKAQDQYAKALGLQRQPTTKPKLVSCTTS